MEEGILQSLTANEILGSEKVVRQDEIMVSEMSYAVMDEAPREWRRAVEVPVPQARSSCWC